MEFTQKVSTFNQKNKYYQVKLAQARQRHDKFYDDTRTVANGGSLNQHNYITSMSKRKRASKWEKNDDIIKGEIKTNRSPVLAPYDGNCKVGYIHGMYSLLANDYKPSKEFLIYLDILFFLNKEKSFFIATLTKDTKSIIPYLKEKFVINYINEVKIGYSNSFVFHLGIVNHYGQYGNKAIEDLKTKGQLKDYTVDPIEGVEEYYDMNFGKEEEKEKEVKRAPQMAKCLVPTRTLTKNRFYKIRPTKTEGVVKVRNDQNELRHYKALRFEL